MHFHLPKPMHGWREFVGEVGIIVVGVLIALGAEQVVETWHDQRLAHETRLAVIQEFGENLSSVQLRGTAEVCVGRRLEELRSIVDRWGRTGTFPTPQWVSMAPSLTINLPNYDAASAAGRLALLPSDEQRQMGAVADALRLFNKLQEEQFDVWADLRMLQSGADALSSSDRSIIRQALQRAAYLDYRSKLVIKQLLPMAASYGFRPDFRQFRERAKLIWKSGHFTPSICAPIDTPPARANAMTGQQVPLPS